MSTQSEDMTTELREQRTWPDEIVQRLQLVSQIFANALPRKPAGAAGAVGGAAVSALIGEIASDDAGKGAAWGAAAGLIIARRRARMAKSEASQQVEQQSEQTQQVTAEPIDNFKKAFSVCLEAKKYMVKF